LKTYEKLLRFGVFSINDVDAIYGNRNSAASAIRTLQKNGLVKSIKKNLYVCNDIENRAPVADKFKIGSSITKDAYISHHSALEFHGVGHQLFFVVYISSGSVFKHFEFEGITYRYAASKFSDGVETYNTNRGVRVSNLERTVIDCIKDIDKSGGIEELLQCLRLITFLDSKKMMQYLGLYNIQFLYQKAGFLLKQFQDELKLPDSFFSFCRENIVKSKRYLTCKDEKDLVYNAEWRLFVPENLMAFMEQGGGELV
jgi:predicted transcriptional regulator of viral defense system